MAEYHETARKGSYNEIERAITSLRLEKIDAMTDSSIVPNVEHWHAKETDARRRMAMAEAELTKLALLVESRRQMNGRN